MYRYIFYTQESLEAPRMIRAVKHCKRPRATKIYKHLERMFHSGEVAVFGYSIETFI
jgi:hypothetical protein